jgi:predicted methyltransferase MtxX (methanogen marker protein 4)
MSNDEVDPETFFLETWDIVQLPAVKKARLTVCESLGDKTLNTVLCESYAKASDEDKQLMKETLEQLKLDVKLQEAKENNIPLEEGLLTGLIGGIAGAAFGPKVMTAVCNALGIDLKGPLGSLMTSRIILTAVGAKVGW